MSNRREFIRTGALAMGAIAVGTAWAGVDASDSGGLAGTLPLYLAVFDDRFPDSTAFAAQARLRGVRTEALDRGDVTRLWYDDLYHRWKQGPAAIAGLTTPDALFVLETFGNDAGLRLRFKAEHRFEGRRIEHRLHGSDAMLRAALPLEASGAGWSAHMGQILSRPRGVQLGRRDARLMTQVGTQAGGERNLLVSWILAPRTPTIISA